MLAAWMEWKAEPVPPAVPVRGEIGLWLLYSFFGAFAGWFLALWVWLMISTTHVLVGLAPSVLAPWGDMIGGMIGLIWFVLLMWGVMWLAEIGATDLFRRTIRRVLGVQVSNEKILYLLEKVPLDAEVKAQFAARIRDEGMSEEVAEALLDMLWETGQAGSAALQLGQALMNWLEKREG